MKDHKKELNWRITCGTRLWRQVTTVYIVYNTALCENRALFPGNYNNYYVYRALKSHTLSARLVQMNATLHVHVHSHTQTIIIISHAFKSFD